MTSGGGKIVRCVESVLGQRDFEIDDVEILLINDGSTDNSSEVLERLADQYPAVIRLIQQENRGVAKTRNRGISLAKGTYTTFIDQDDWIDETYLRTLYDCALSGDRDVVISGYRRPNQEGAIVMTFQPKQATFSRYTLSAAWAKLHRTEFLRANTIEFMSTTYGEDLPFTAKENLVTDNYEVMNYIGYNWYCNQKSVSNTVQKKLTPDNITSIQQLLATLSAMDPDKSSHDHQYYIVRTAVYYLLFSGRGSSRQQFMAGYTQFVVPAMKNGVTLRTIVRNYWRGERGSATLTVMITVLLGRLRLMPLLALIWCRG